MRFVDVAGGKWQGAGSASSRHCCSSLRELKKTTKASVSWCPSQHPLRNKNLSTWRFLYYPEYGDRTLPQTDGNWQDTFSQNTVISKLYNKHGIDDHGGSRIVWTVCSLLPTCTASHLNLHIHGHNYVNPNLTVKLDIQGCGYFENEYFVKRRLFRNVAEFYVVTRCKTLSWRHILWQTVNTLLLIIIIPLPSPLVESSWNVMAHGDEREGKWRGNKRMEWVTSKGHMTAEHRLARAVQTLQADVHSWPASSRLNWRPRRFKWIRPFRPKTKSGFCACAITFPTQSTTAPSALALPAVLLSRSLHLVSARVPSHFQRSLPQPVQPLPYPPCSSLGPTICISCFLLSTHLYLPSFHRTFWS